MDHSEDTNCHTHATHIDHKQPSSPPASSSHPSVNPEALNQLREFATQEMITKMVTQFLQGVEESVEEVLQAVQNNDAESFRKAAHGLKGICLNMGAERLGHLAASLERRAKEENQIPSDFSKSQFSEEMASVQDYFRHVLAI